MAEFSHSEVRNDAAVEVVRAADVPEPAKQSKWYRWRKDGTALVYYLLDSEVHTFAFSVAANAILSFIPFIVLLYSLVDTVFHRSEMMMQVINDMVRYFMPSNQDFIVNSLADVAAASSRHGLQLFSLIMILVACTGIFLPLEVALNKAWGVTKSRNYLHNQAIAFGLAILMLQFDRSFHSIEDLRDIGLPVVGGISMLGITVPMRRRVLSAASFAMAVLLLCAVYGGLVYRLLQTPGAA